MLSISKSTICGVADKPILVVARGKTSTFFDALDAGTVFKSYPDAEILATFPIGKKLKEGEHDSPPKGYPESRDEYAVPSTYTFPLDSSSRIRSALAYFDKHKFDSASQKKEAAKRMLSAAKKHGIEVSKDDDVYKAAHD